MSSGRARVGQSRKSTVSIMAHQGYGAVTVIRKGIEFTLPESALFSDGRIKKYALAEIERYFNHVELENTKEIV